MNIKSEIQILLDDSETKELNYAKGNAFEKMIRWFLECRDYSVVSNMNTTNGEVDLWCKHNFDDETLLVECKAKKKVHVGDLHSFGFKVFTKKPNKAYFIHTIDLDHDSSGIKEEEFDKTEAFKNVTFYGPQKIIELFLSQNKIASIDRSILPKEITKRFLIFSYVGDFYVFIANTTTLASPNEFTILNASDGTSVNDKKIIQILKNRIPELDKLDFKSIVSNNNTITKQQNIIIESVVEIPESESWNDYKPASSEHFVGRSAIRYDFLHLFKDVLNEKTKKRIFYLSAKSGMGKSSLINAIKGMCSNKQHKNKFFAYAVDSINAESQRFVGLAFERIIKEAIKTNFIEKNQLKINKISFISDYDLLNSKSIQQILTYLKQENKILILIFDQFEDVFRREHLYRPFHEFLLHVHNAQSNLIVGFSWKSEITLSPMSDSNKFWTQAKNLAKPFELEGFNNEELNQIIKQLENEPKVGHLPKGFKNMLTQYSLGFPWLIKKLCIHIFNEVKSGKKISELSNANLNITTLFKQDIEQISTEENKALLLIAKYAETGTFLHDSDIPELVSIEVITSLLQRRLIIKTGLVYKPYWDVFREFILTGDIPPLTFNFIIHQSPIVCFGIFKNFIPGKKFSIDDLYDISSKQKKLKKETIINILIELQRLDLVDKDESSGKFFLPNKIQPTKQDFVKLSKIKIKNTKAYTDLNTSNESLIGSKQLGSILKKSFKYTSISDESWNHYAKIFINWIYYLDLEKKTVLIKKERGRGSLKDYANLKHNLILQTYPDTLCEVFKNVLEKGLMQYKNVFQSNISRDLMVLGIVEKKDGVFSLKKNYEYLKTLSYENENEFKKQIAKAAFELDKIKKATNIIRNNHKISASKFYLDYPELFGKGIKTKKSGNVYASKMIAWADFILRDGNDTPNLLGSNIIKEKAIKNLKQIEGLLKANSERSIEAWNTQYQKLEEYFKKNNHVNLKARDGALGTWVVAQRQYKKSLTKEQISKLDKLNFVWDPRELMWEETFQEWLIYKETHPNRKLIVQDKEFPKLGRWINIQRRLHKEKKLLRHRYLKLDSENFPWDTGTKWIDNYNLLKKFYSKNGHIKLPSTSEFKKLKGWINTQKHRMKKGEMSLEKVELLKQIEF